MLSTERQTKMKKATEEDHFYQFLNLWNNILMKEGWNFVQSPKQALENDNRPTSWYSIPGRSVNTGGIQGTDFLNNWDDVVRYCKDQNYYAKYHREEMEASVNANPAQCP